MTTESITRARANLYNLIEQVNASGEPVILTNNRGKNAVLIAEDDWRSIQETLYLASVPSLTENILKAVEEPLDDCSVYDSEEDW